MIDDNTNKVLAVATSAGIIGLVTGIARGVVQQKHNGWGGFFRGLVASVLVAVLMGWTLADLDVSPTKQAVIIGVCAYLADDVLLGLQEVARLFGADPFGTLQRIWQAVRGQAGTAPSDRSKGDQP